MQNFKKSGNMENFICVLVSLAMIIILTQFFYPKGTYIRSQLPVYKGLHISSELENHIANVDNYIMTALEKGENVYIMDSSSTVYSIPINKYTKDIDMLLIGNIGGKSVMDFDIDYENSKFMIKSDITQLNWQFDKKWYDTFNTQFKKTGEEYGFDIFEKEN